MRMQTLMSGMAIAFLLGSPLAAQQEETAVPVDRTPDVRGTGPNGATLRCRDGFYPAPGAADAACAARGGVLVRFPTTHNADRRGASLEAPRGAVAERRGTLPTPRADSAAPPAGVTPWAEQQAKAREEGRRGPAPLGARLLCTDGTYVVADTSSARCANHGGVQLRLGEQAPRVQVRPTSNP
jgi:hypothetical protein